MPFNFTEYKEECESMTLTQFHIQKQHYTRVAASCCAGGTLGIGFAFLTFGLSAISSAVSLAAGINAGLKLEIIDSELRDRLGGYCPDNRKRDKAAGLPLGAGTAALGPGAGHGAGQLVGEGLLSHSTGIYSERCVEYALDGRQRKRGY